MAIKRTRRKQLLKEPDEFLTMTARLLSWSQAHPKQLIYGGVALLAVVLLISGIGYYRQQRQQTAADLLSQGLAKYQAEADEAGNQGGGQSWENARADFKHLVEDYGSQPAGRLGRVLYAHLSMTHMATQQAIDLYKKALADFDKDPSLSNVVLYGLASAYARSGERVKAIETFEEIVAGSSPVHKDSALFSLGLLYQQEGQKEKSIKAFEQLSTDFPDSTYAQMAREQLSG